MTNVLIALAVVAAIVGLGLFRGWFKPVPTAKAKSKRSVSVDRNRSNLLKRQAEDKAKP